MTAGGTPDRPSFVFKMGIQKANMAINMDRNGSHLLRTSFVILMGKGNIVVVS